MPSNIDTGCMEGDLLKNGILRLDESRKSRLPWTIIQLYVYFQNKDFNMLVLYSILS